MIDLYCIMAWPLIKNIKKFEALQLWIRKISWVEKITSIKINRKRKSGYSNEML